MLRPRQKNRSKIVATLTLPGQLTSADPLGAGRDAYFDDYVLVATEGQPVTLTLNSDEFDTYLQVFDLDSGNFVAFNDDSGVSSNAQLAFTPLPGIRYRIRTTSFERAEGNYALTASNPADLIPNPVIIGCNPKSGRQYGSATPLYC